jgi:hypothetical protein
VQPFPLGGGETSLARLTVAAATVLGVASLVVAPGWVHASNAGARACANGYGYAGVASRYGVGGVAATITAVEAPGVASGHAAAWVGVGGAHAGRGGSSAWLQAGLAAFPRAGLRLYVEAVSPGHRRRFVDLGPVAVGQHYRVSVVEVARNVWRAVVDGRAVSRPAYVPAPRGSWRGVATAETWASAGAACNTYAYRFDSVSVLGKRGWTPAAAVEAIGSPHRRRTGSFSATA